MPLESLKAPNPDVISRVTAAKSALSEEIVYIDATAGVVGHPETGKTYVPDFYKQADLAVAMEAKGNGYNFAGNQAFLNHSAKMIFGDDADLAKIGKWPASGGSHAIALGNTLFAKGNQTDTAHEVLLGSPTWPGHKGLIERTGNKITNYRYLTESGDFNMDAFLTTLEGRTKVNPEVSVLFHGVCQNPLGIDIPQKYWEEIATMLKAENTPLQIDLAYLGFATGVEEDSAMLRYFHQQGVPMLVFFSGSKLYHSYGENRIGAGFAANFENPKDIQANALFEIRQSTSAVPERGQRIADKIETNAELLVNHRKWLTATRDRVAQNRTAILDIIGEKAPDYMRDTKGIFMQFAHQKPEELGAKVFPELGKQMKWGDYEHAPDLSRVAVIPVADEGVRLNLAALNSESSAAVAKTLARYL